MVFSSATFLFVFLPAVLLLYFVPFFRKDRQKEFTKKNIVLCLSSLVFYAWGEPVYIVLMLLSIFYNYNAGIDLESHEDEPKARRRIFVCAIIFNLFVLGFFKYSGFVVENLNSLFSLGIKYEPLALPIGISFYTFQVMSYIIDVYRGDCKTQHSLLNFATYISMFPQLIAGPIVQYNDVEKYLSYREHNVRKFAAGSLFFIRGLGKKVIFANTIGAVYTQICSDGVSSLSAVNAWFAILCYTLQIYFDFSGYSDMAVGLGKMFGFDLVHNFNFPYCAVSIKDFWSRWHISLSSWFRDYVYIPLGGNRKGPVRQTLNLLIVWLLTGLWHGAAWNFVLWGLYYAILLIAEKRFLGAFLQKLWKPVRHLYALLAVLFGWVIFNCSGIGQIGGYLGAMFGQGTGIPGDASFLYLLTQYKAELFLAVLFCLPLPKVLRRQYDSQPWMAIACDGLLLAVFGLSVVSITVSSFNPFIYFRF